MYFLILFFFVKYLCKLLLFAIVSIEGVVVAVEFEEKLLDAWQKDEDERERKLKEVNFC